MFRRFVLPPVLLLVLATGAALAQHHATTVGDITVADAKSRPTIPNRPAAIYVTISNAGAEADRLVRAGSAAFADVEIHKTEMKDGVMRMMPVEGIEIPAGGTVTLEPGGLHLMAFGAPDPLEKGEIYPLELVFEKAGRVHVMVSVGRIDGAGHGGHSGHSGHGTTN